MSQVYAIKLYFDQDLENHVLKAWNVMSRRQLSTKLIKSGSRPHLTLFSSHCVDISKLEGILREFASKQQPLSLSLSSVGILPNENNVLFLGPTPSVSLLQFHSQLCDAMKTEGIEIEEDYRPDNWIPCCPVSWAEEVPKNRVAEGVTVLRDLKLPFNGFAVHLAVVEYLPWWDSKLFVEELIATRKFEGVNYTFWDETCTTKGVFHSLNKSAKPVKPAVPYAISEEYAAFEILERYLDFFNGRLDQTLYQEFGQPKSSGNLPGGSKET